MTKNSQKVMYFASVVALVMLFSIFVLEKTQVINIYNKPASAVDTSPVRPVNDIRYEPATSQEDDEVNNQKNTAIEESNKPAIDKSITVSYSALGQDVNGGPIVVRALIDGTSSGTCNLTLTKASSQKTYTANVVNLGTYYGCDGFSVPVSDVTPGTWNAKLIIVNGSKQGVAMQDFEVTL